MPDKWSDLSEDEVAERGRQSHGYYGASIELQNRQTKAQIAAAESAKRSVRWMAVSVVVLEVERFTEDDVQRRLGREVDAITLRLAMRKAEQRGFCTETLEVRDGSRVWRSARYYRERIRR